MDEVGDLPVDCIVEVKDKEQSVLRAQEFLRWRLGAAPAGEAKAGRPRPAGVLRPS